jgi:predicted nucleic acid-binding protein
MTLRMFDTNAISHYIKGRLRNAPSRQSADRYGLLRAEMQRIGKSLSALDMLIAAHALSLGATLVTTDAAFRHVPGLSVEDWS